MNRKASWIWLNNVNYPDIQSGEFTYFSKDRENNRYILADFIKQEHYNKTIIDVDVNISADVRFWLYVNDKYVGMGPVCPGGDFGNIRPLNNHYYNSYNIKLNSKDIEIYVQVQKNVTTQCDMSQGHGGLIIECTLHFDDGSEDKIVTDESWEGRINTCRTDVNKSDFTRLAETYKPVSMVDAVWNLSKSEIDNIIEESITPVDFEQFSVNPGEFKIMEFEYDKIYSGCFKVDLEASGDYIITIKSYERDKNSALTADEIIIGNNNLSFRGNEMHSVGMMIMYICNNSEKPLEIKNVGLYFMHYPESEQRGDFKCSDETFNTIYNMGRWALKICRQTIELDSPKHQENLGCTGDYFISSLMNYFTDGDCKLSRFDIIRTANYLDMTDGYMFHTTYSMIWIMMLYDNYMFSGDKSVLYLSQAALKKLLKRFESYIDERGIISKPLNYMFVDWLAVDGYSMHHPPMSMGQSVLNAFYIGGLEKAIEIYKILNDTESADQCITRLEKSKNAFNKYFYDPNRGLYFDGLNESYDTNRWLPENNNKKYFSWHTNSLAVLFDIASRNQQRGIIEKILNDMDLINPQPYFMHFVLEAIYKVGLFKEYGINQLKRWECMTDFTKGLQEGWYKPELSYQFDYSHVWAGTPTYQLPSKLSGLTIVEPGLKTIILKPNLFGLDFARIKTPSKYGIIDIDLKKGRKPIISIPEGIKADIIEQ